MRKILLAMTALLAAYMSDAQMPALINSGLLLQQGNQLHEEGKYKEAIALYKTVPRNDTNYLRVLYELAMSHERDSSFEQALLAIRSAEEMGTGAMRARFQLMKANVYDDMSQPARALAIYDSVLVEYPESDEAMLNRAITLMRLDRHAEAETQLKTLLVNNPYYASAHMKIAGCALKQGRIVPGMMALFTYLIVSPEGRHSRSAINLLNELSNYSPETQEIIQGRKQEDEVFAREERVVLSKMAFDRNYKLQTDIDDKIIRQLQALFDIVKYDESSSDFYMQYYVPFLRTMAEKKRFEPVVMHAFSGVKLEVIQKYHKKHSREVKAAIDDIVAYLDGIRGTRELIANKRSSAPALYAIANNRFVGKGLSNAKQDPVGDWEYYYEQGNLKAIAHYNSEGKREGTWKYFYANGRVSGIDHWSNGVQTGTDTVYFMDGVLSSTSFYKDGELDGNRTLYHGNGRIKSVTMFKNGKEEGPYKLYFSSGRTQVEGSMKDEKIHGAFTRYYRTGVKELECM
ncbi:MAG: tetratricopeptide repeat protein, partial [Chitinophagaceae bacterium]